MRRSSVIVFLATLTACSDQQARQSEPTSTAERSPAIPSVRVMAPPDPDRCRFADPLSDEERLRTTPLPIPAALNGIAASNKDAIAVRTLDDEPYCLDARWMGEVEGMALSADGRMLSFDWSGYEAYGHLIVDRTGKGQEVDTGAAPVASASGSRLAAVEYSESGYGALNGLAVWQVEPVGIRRLGKVEDMPFLFQWQVDRWVGETCVEVSAVLLDAMPENGWVKDPSKRKHFTYRDIGGRWTLRTSNAQGCEAR